MKGKGSIFGSLIFDPKQKQCIRGDLEKNRNRLRNGHLRISDGQDNNLQEDRNEITILQQNCAPLNKTLQSQNSQKHLHLFFNQNAQ